MIHPGHTCNYFEIPPKNHCNLGTAWNCQMQSKSAMITNETTKIWAPKRTHTHTHTQKRKNLYDTCKAMRKLRLLSASIASSRTREDEEAAATSLSSSFSSSSTSWDDNGDLAWEEELVANAMLMFLLHHNTTSSTTTKKSATMGKSWKSATMGKMLRICDNGEILKIYGQLWAKSCTNSAFLLKMYQIQDKNINTKPSI